MHQWSGSALVQVMSCHLFGAKPLSEPILSIRLLGTNFSEIWIRILSFSFKECIWNCCLPQWWPFGPDWDELKSIQTCIMWYCQILSYQWSPTQLVLHNMISFLQNTHFYFNWYSLTTCRINFILEPYGLVFSDYTDCKNATHVTVRGAIII